MTWVVNHDHTGSNVKTGIFTQVHLVQKPITVFTTKESVAPLSSLLLVAVTGSPLVRKCMDIVELVCFQVKWQNDESAWKPSFVAFRSVIKRIHDSFLKIIVEG